MVPRPTVRKKPPAQMLVMTKPMGKKARFTPGRMNGSAASRAKADTWAALMGVSVCVEKKPLTKEASRDERLALTSRLLLGFLATSSICGIRSSLNASLLMVNNILD